MRTVAAKIALLLVLILLSGCSNSPDRETHSESTFFPFINFALTLQDTWLTSFKNDLNLTSELAEDAYIMGNDIEQMADRVDTSLNLTAQVLDLLAQLQTFNPEYETVFSRNAAYDEVTPYFSIDTNSSKTYMLVSSSTRLFVPQTTIKTLFHDNTSLTTAWQRALQHHRSGNLYLNIYEIKADGTVQRSGTPAVISGSALDALTEHPHL